MDMTPGTIASPCSGVCQLDPQGLCLGCRRSGREIASAPTVLMAAYPVRGLDINSSYLIYHLLNQQKEKGVAVIYVGEDLDVLLALCDRVIVLSGGRVTGTVDGRTATKEEIGLLMTKAEREGESHVKAE